MGFVTFCNSEEVLQILFTTTTTTTKPHLRKQQQVGHLELLEVVYEDVGQPEVVYKV